MSDHVLVMTPGPGGQYQGHGEDAGEISLVLGGDLMAKLSGEDGIAPEAFQMTLTPTEAPKDDEPAAEGDEGAMVDPDAHSKDELIAMAGQAGVSAEGTKQDIADRLNEAATAP